MTINRRDFLLASAAAGLLVKGAKTAAAQPKKASPPAKRSRTDGRTVTVYTTAEKTTHRMSQTDTLTFKSNAEPPTPIMVDPTKTFQTFLGIGGALTDASAEVFAKLPKDKQQKFLEAYFDPQKG